MSNSDRVVVQSDTPSFFGVDISECESWRFRERSEPHFWRTPSGVFFAMADDWEEESPPRYEAFDVALAMICTPTMIHMPPARPPAPVEPSPAPAPAAPPATRKPSKSERDERAAKIMASRKGDMSGEELGKLLGCHRSTAELTPAWLEYQEKRVAFRKHREDSKYAITSAMARKRNSGDDDDEETKNAAIQRRYDDKFTPAQWSRITMEYRDQLSREKYDLFNRMPRDEREHDIRTWHSMRVV